MDFYLGTHQVNWLTSAPCPLFVSHRRLARVKKLPTAAQSWCLDSGGFSELSMFGTWQTSPRNYVDATRRYIETIGQMRWAAIQDWMCEPFMIAKTGLSIREHQIRTINSYDTLISMAPDIPWLPILQGYSPNDYIECLEMYRKLGHNNISFGVGSVCRRQATDEAGQIFDVLKSEGINIHAFGVKKKGLIQYANMLTSADSMAWSFDARYMGYSWCGAWHSNCANCMQYALHWRQQLLAMLAEC